MTNLCGEGLGLWDEQDKFYYDWLFRRPAKVPAQAPLARRADPAVRGRSAGRGAAAERARFARRMEWYLQLSPGTGRACVPLGEPGAGDTRLSAIGRVFRMKRVLDRMLDEREFLSPYGVRAISRVYRDQPYVFEFGGFRSEVKYTPAESDSGLFGGNSNWRGPIWMPINYLMVESLRKFGAFYGDGFRVECPTGSGRKLTLVEMADELRNRLTRIFLRDAHGRRPVFSGYEKMQTDPHFKD